MRFVRTFVRLVPLFLSFALAFGEAGSPGSVISNETRSTSPVVVIGFLGGFVGHNNQVHSTVQVVEHLRNEYLEGVYVQSFENRHPDRAYKEILQRLDVNTDGKLSTDEKQHARIVIFGHSWGASETVALARKLGQNGIPVLLTVQVDSVAKIGQNDSVIPANVGQAINFYQPDGIVHGRPQIRAADPARTEILGNFRYDYKAHPISCEGYPWFDRILVKTHTEIECDPKVWSQVESLIYSKLSREARKTAAR
jgi:pimeloyl-ACP methyl ester carboxylesterase